MATTYRAMSANAFAAVALIAVATPMAIGEATLTAIRDATNKSWVLGTGRFREEIAAAVSRRLAPLPKGRPKKAEE